MLLRCRFFCGGVGKSSSVVSRPVMITFMYAPVWTFALAMKPLCTCLGVFRGVLIIRGKCRSIGGTRLCTPSKSASASSRMGTLRFDSGIVCSLKSSRWLAERKASSAADGAS